MGEFLHSDLQSMPEHWLEDVNRIKNQFHGEVNDEKAQASPPQHWLDDLERLETSNQPKVHQNQTDVSVQEIETPDENLSPSIEEDPPTVQELKQDKYTYPIADTPQDKQREDSHTIKTVDTASISEESPINTIKTTPLIEHDVPHEINTQTPLKSPLESSGTTPSNKSNDIKKIDEFKTKFDKRDNNESQPEIIHLKENTTTIKKIIHSDKILPESNSTDNKFKREVTSLFENKISDTPSTETSDHRSYLPKPHNYSNDHNLESIQTPEKTETPIDTHNFMTFLDEPETTSTQLKKTVPIPKLVYKQETNEPLPSIEKLNENFIQHTTQSSDSLIEPPLANDKNHIPNNKEVITEKHKKYRQEKEPLTLTPKTYIPQQINNPYSTLESTSSNLKSIANSPLNRSSHLKEVKKETIAYDFLEDQNLEKKLFIKNDNFHSTHKTKQVTRTKNLDPVITKEQPWPNLPKPKSVLKQPNTTPSISPTQHKQIMLEQRGDIWNV